MAQRGTWTERMGKARAALSGGAGRARTWKVASAAALACAAFVAAGLWLAAPPSGVVVERATQAPDAATTAAPATSAQAATAATGDRIETAGVMFHRRLREGFFELAHAEPKRFAVIDATQPIERVSALVQDSVSRLING